MFGNRRQFGPLIFFPTVANVLILVLFASFGFLLPANADSLSSVRALGGESCPFPLGEVAYAYDREETAKLTFFFRGTSPSLYLSAGYQRLANCAPQALKPKFVDYVDDTDLQAAGERMRVLPKQDIRPKLGFYEKAVKTLNDNGIYWNSDSNFATVDFSGKTVAWFKIDISSIRPFGSKHWTTMKRLRAVPTIKVNKLENRAHYVHLSKGETPRRGDGEKRGRKASPAAFPTPVDLAKVCRGLGHYKDCITKDSVRKRTVKEIVKGQKVEIPVDYFAYVPHYELEVEIEFPRSKAKLLADDMVAYIISKNPVMQGKKGRFRPYYTGLRVASPSSTPSTSALKTQCRMHAKIWAALEQKIGLVIEDKHERNSPVKILIVEPYSEIDHGSIDKFKHKYYTQPTTTSCERLLPKSSPPASDVDPGHALHVSHIIGGRARINGWTGLAAYNKIKLAHTDRISRILGKDLSKLVLSLSKKDQMYRIYNFSFMFGKGRCNPEKGDDPNAQSAAEAIRGIVNKLNRENAAALFVISTTRAEIKHCKYGIKNPINYKVDECPDLACSGRLDNVMTVVGLGSDLETPRQETRFADGFRMIAAPGTGIFSADQASSRSKRKGYRLRQGASQAAAFVSATAARIARRYPFLSGRHIKERLAATVTLPPENGAKYLYGILNMRRAIESDPAQFTLWSSSSGKPSLAGTGQVHFFGNTDDIVRFANIPPVKPENGGVPKRSIKSIFREPLREGFPTRFRILYRKVGGSLEISPPFDFQFNDDLNKICELDGKLGQTQPPCLMIDAKGIDITEVTHIVFPTDFFQ